MRFLHQERPALTAFGRGNRDGATIQELVRLRGEAERVGLKATLPELESALAKASCELIRKSMIFDTHLLKAINHSMSVCGTNRKCHRLLATSVIGRLTDITNVVGDFRLGSSLCQNGGCRYWCRRRRARMGVLIGFAAVSRFLPSV